MTDRGTEVPAVRRTVADVLAEAGAKGFFLLVAPWWRLDRDAPLHVRLWRWRYVYLMFGAVTILATWEGITTGTVGPALLAVGPHVLGLVLLAYVLTGEAIAGVGLPLVDVPDLWVLGGVVAGGWIAVLGQLLRYRVRLPGIPSVPYYQERGEFVAPMATAQASDDAPALPRLDQGVSTLVLGETGSGKTAALQLLAYQLPYDEGTAVIAHDFGTEHQAFYRDRGFEVLRIGVEGGDVVWNLFADVQQEREFRELASAVFGEPRGSDPFHRPAKQVFEAALTYVYREYGDPATGDPPDHTDLLAFLENDRATIRQRLAEYDDLAGAAAHLDAETGKAAMNVYQSLREHVEAVFVGEFAATGEFSLREYVEDPRGRVLVIDSTPAETETVGPMFRLLLDWAIRYAMESATPTNFLLDELDQLPALSRLPTLAARGRGTDSRVLVGVQTLGQLEAQYGDDVSGVIGNCPQGIYFSGGDPETVEYVQSEIGQERQHVDSTTLRHRGRGRGRTEGSAASASSSTTVSEQDRYPVTSATLKALGTGECVVKSREHWWLGSLDQLAAIEHRLVADPTPADSAVDTDGDSGPDADSDPEVEGPGPDPDVDGANPDPEVGSPGPDPGAEDPEPDPNADPGPTSGPPPAPTLNSSSALGADSPSSTEQTPEPSPSVGDGTRPTSSGQPSSDRDQPADPAPESSIRDRMAAAHQRWERDDDSADDGPPTDDVSSTDDSALTAAATTEREQERWVIAVDPDTYPSGLTSLDQWLTWKATDDGRKVPRAPWASDWPDKYVDAQDPANWTSYGRAREAADRHAGHDLAFVIRDRDEFPDESIVLIDYDHARDPASGAIHQTVQEHIDRAGSYADVSTSGTGVHILCRGALPEDVKSIDAPLPDDPAFPDAEIEVYDSARFVAMTGQHLASTPTHTGECQGFIEELAEEFATVTEAAPDQVTQDPVTPRHEIADIETTDDIQDVLDAIQHIRPAEIHLRSTVTEERSDGSKSLDPSWERSESGTRLAQVEDGWIYRKGMHGLDAAQVVALEERIIHRPDEYPSGDDFWATVRALRDRGAHIPIFEPRESPPQTTTIDGDH